MREQAHHDREDKTECEDDDGHAGSTHRRQQEQDDGDEEDEDGEEDNHEASEGVDAGCGVEGYGCILSLVLLRAAFEEVLEIRSWPIVKITENEVLEAALAWRNEGNEVLRVKDPGEFRSVERLPCPKPFEDAVVVSGGCLVQRLELLEIQE